MGIFCASLRESEALNCVRIATAIVISFVYLFVGYNHQHIHFDSDQIIASTQLANDFDPSEKNDDGRVQTHDHCHSCFPALSTPLVTTGLAMTKFAQAFFVSARPRSVFRAALDPPPPRVIA